MKKTKLVDKIRQSPINYFSDLFITAMVLMWIIDNVYQSIVATSVTISSIILSLKTGTNCYDTSMWSSIGTGAIWMIKNSIQHAISNYRGKLAPKDFPAIHPEGENEKIELEETSSDIEEFKETELTDGPLQVNISEKRKKWRRLEHG